MAPVRPTRRAYSFAVLLAVCSFLAFAGWRSPSVRAAAPDVVTIAPGAAVHLATPTFLVAGKRYAFTWPGGGPPQTFLVKTIRDDGWILVEVADETIKPELFIPGEFPTRWLHVALALSIQEMRPLP
jgi:hypothetical protein